MDQLINKARLLGRKRELVSLLEYANQHIAEIDSQIKQIDEEQTE